MFQLIIKLKINGEDNREFWVRTEKKNRLTAEKYNILELADYVDIKAFKRYKF